MANEKGRAREQMSKLINSATPLVTDWMARRRRTDLTGFLGAVAATTPEQVLADPQGLRDAHDHLVVRWTSTVEQVARPDSLPEVIKRRERVRVHPAAPAATAGIASIGTWGVVAADLAAPFAAGGVLGVVALTAAISAAAWKPRARAADRRYTLQGTPALVARAQTELADFGLPALGAGPDNEAEATLTRLLGSAHQLEELERSAHGSGILDAMGGQVQPPRTPAEQALMHEVLQRRLDLVHALVRLGTLGHAEGARLRAEFRQGYGSSLEDG